MKKTSVDAKNTLEQFKDQIVAASNEHDAQLRHAAVSTLVENVTDECKGRSLYYQLLQLVLLCTIFVHTMIVMYGYYNSKIELERVRMEISMSTKNLKTTQDPPAENFEKVVFENHQPSDPTRISFGIGKTITTSGGMWITTPGVPLYIVPSEK